MRYQDLMNLKYVDLIGSTEPTVNSLRLYFERRKVSEVVEKFELGDSTFEGSDVIIDEKLPIIQMDFDNYISYSVTNESFTVWDEYEEFEGKAFRIYIKSCFLDYIQNSTIASEVYPGPFKHYGMVCIDHIINIVSISEPTIIEVER
ncbi:hypothetical protein [Neobacillus vireti]|uniref:hypothetical protein n=1 Tax=Neobacillus vireti TaxID=220686 RepID=UPI002FFEB6B8